MKSTMTPTTVLATGEEVLKSFRANRVTYTRNNAWLAAVAMTGGMIVLWAVGNPHAWAGALGGLLAVTVRAFYLMSEEMSVRWDLTNKRLLGPQTRAIRLGEIKTVNTLGSMVQIITHSGDKHLIKYQADRNATAASIKNVMVGGRG